MKHRLISALALALVVSGAPANAAWPFPDTDLDLVESCKTTPIARMTVRQIELCASMARVAAAMDAAREAARGPGEFVPVDQAAERRKRATISAEGGYHDPGSASVCQPPHRMTKRDGCQ